MLTEPYLVLGENGQLAVVWCTEFPGDAHYVAIGDAPLLRDIRRRPQEKAGVTFIVANSEPVTGLAEDIESHTRRTDLLPLAAERVRVRQVWRHSATLPVGVFGAYRVLSLSKGESGVSKTYRLWAEPDLGSPVSILLTSDHQMSPLATAGMSAAAKLGGYDAVLFAGDLVNMAGRGADWFDHANDSAFFATMQGRAAAELAGRSWRGGAFLQHAPILPVHGNHEFSGRRQAGALIGETFNETQPYTVLPRGGSDLRARDRELRANGTEVYRQLFAGIGVDEGWYAVTVGNTRVIGLSAAAIWRPTVSSDRPQRHEEQPWRAEDPLRWGYGHHVLGFGLAQDSPQYAWLVAELRSSAFAAAAVRVVVLHHPPRHLAEQLRVGRKDGSQDDEAIPFVDPTAHPTRDAEGRFVAVHYEYREPDRLLEVESVLGSAGVDLILCGHSHIWNRFHSPWGPIVLETSNSGGTRVPRDAETVPMSSVVRPHSPVVRRLADQTGLPAAFPSIEPMLDATGRVVPYLSSGRLSAFSVLDTGARVVRSYYVDPWAGGNAVLFDVVRLGPGVRVKV